MQYETSVLQNHFGIASSLSQIKKKIQDWAKIGSVGLVETQHFFFSALWKYEAKCTKGQVNFLRQKCFVFLACLYGSTLLVFGGTGVPFGETASNDIHRCNLKTLEWSSMQCEGPAPIRSYGHVSVLNNCYNLMLTVLMGTIRISAQWACVPLSIWVRLEASIPLFGWLADPIRLHVHCGTCK